MLKKKYNLKKQIILKYNYLKGFFIKLINLSLSVNFSLNPLDRLSYLSQSETTDSLFYKFSTYQKLICLISLSHKVPNRKTNYSRFFLNKQLDKLVISNTLK